MVMYELEAPHDEVTAVAKMRRIVQAAPFLRERHG